jgi:DNA polymerase III subunit delta
VKFYSNQLQKVANSLKAGEIRAALLYGPDHGLIEYSLSEISKLLGFTRQNLSFDNSSASEINSALNNKSFFADKEIITIKNMPSNPDASTKLLFDKEHHNFLMVASGELTPASPIRKLFEGEKNLAAIACYNDDEQSIEQIIKGYLIKEGKKIEPDAMKYLKSNLHGDRFIIINELEKLFCYSFDKDEITSTDVELAISTSHQAAPDRLCLYFMLGSKKNFFRELDQAIANNIPSVWVIRAIIRYYVNAYSALHDMKDGIDEEKAISSVPNQIFFKYKPAFKRALNILNIDKVKHALDSLYIAEKQIKSGAHGYKDLLLRCFFDCL